jgi:hypothetical protein
VVVIWLLRWSTFRLLIGAGMSKLGERSSACWRELSCTETHYFTQPMPNFMAWYFHHLPNGFHRMEVALTFVEQLVIPFAVLVPFRPARIGACLAELFFQLAIAGAFSPEPSEFAAEDLRCEDPPKALGLHGVIFPTPPSPPPIIPVLLGVLPMFGTFGTFPQTDLFPS